jgi:RNA polymerase sigma-70 factor (ECF subfamily)
MSGQAMAEPIDAIPDNLVVQARTSPAALGKLYERHYEPVLRYCIHRLFVREAAEDATGEVFLKVARGIRSFTGPSERDFTNWLYAIATAEVNGVIRRGARRRELLAAAVQQRRLRVVTTSEDSQDYLDWPTLYAAIADLPRRDQTLIVLRSFENVPFERIAAICDLKPVTARVAFTRALAKLRKRLTKASGRGR